MSTVLILPGYGNSGPGHWQTLWEQQLPNARRVQQRNWDQPDREEWVAALDVAIQTSSEPVLLVAHSLGCALAVWWGKEHGNAAHARKVKGALLVAPPDVERADFPKAITGFSPMPTESLPMRAAVAASTDDPWCAFSRAKAWAATWGAQFHDVGKRGHINADSGLGDWPEALSWLAQLAEGVDYLP